MLTINLNPSIPALPRIADKKKVNVRYMLIAPYASAHIYWNDKLGELVYEVEEPILQENEKAVLEKLEEAMLELVNVNVAVEKTLDATTNYIDRTARLLIDELNIKITAEAYNKIFYYLFRDFIGFNEIDPLLKDYFIEDIECNGVDTPVYIIHRVYRNLRTNLSFNNMDKLASFVEKLAQRAGRYISYAQPLLDATLPDGSRINATFTKDVTSRGPSFSVRKFTKIPWTPTQLISMGTLSPEMLAYFWILIENKSSILISGGTASGKCVAGDTPVYLANGQIVNIGELVEQKIRNNKNEKDGGWEFVDGDGTEILSMDNNLKISKARVEKFWRHKSPEYLYKIITKSGREIISTAEHPFFILKEGKLTKIRADELNKEQKIAVPRNLPFFGGIDKNDLYWVEKLKDESNIYVCGVQKEVKRLYGLVIERLGLKNEKELAIILKTIPRTFYSWKKENAIPFKYYIDLIELSGEPIVGEIRLKGDTNGSIVEIPVISKELFRFLGMVISDGHLRKNYVEFHNSRNELLIEFKELGEKLFGLKSDIEDYKYRVKRVRLYSSVISRLLNLVFEIPCGRKARIVVVPKILFEQPDECLKEFISSVFDCEGYVGKKELEIGMTSKKFLNGLSTLLLRFGIVPRTRKERISISSNDYIKKFEYSFNLRHPLKKQKLKELASRVTIHTNVDLVPNCAHLFREARLELELSRKKFAEKIGVSRRLIGMWEEGLRLPSIMSFKKFALQVAELPNPGKEIVKIANSDIFWDSVAEINRIKSDEKYVYDLTVDNHNFLAGNIPMIVHNTTLLNAIAFFIPPSARVVSIEDSVTGDSAMIVKDNKENIRKVTIKEMVDKKLDVEVMSSNKEGKIIWTKPSDYIKHNVTKDIYEILTATGRKIKVTEDHSLFTLGEDNELKDIKPTELKSGESFIAVPRSLPIEGKKCEEINLMEYLNEFKEDFLEGEPVEKLLNKYKKEDFSVKKEKYRWWKNRNIIKIEDYLKINHNFNHDELKKLRIKSKNTSSIPVLFKISKEFLEFCGLWLGDGSYDNYNANSVIVSNVDGECRNIVKNIASYIGAQCSLMNDNGVSIRIHSTIFYKFMKNVLKFDGYSDSKKMPDFIFNLDNNQIRSLIRGYFSADGCVKKNEVSCSSQSYELLSDLQTLMLRFGIIARINDFERKDKCINMSISASENIEKFKEIGFLQDRKNQKLFLMGKKSHHAHSDFIPLGIKKIKELGDISLEKIQRNYIIGRQRIGRSYMQRIAPVGCEFNDLSHNDILWDSVKDVKKINSKEIEVFDLSIPGYEKFICNNIFVHNTREINIPKENWLPAVARTAVGAGKVGEVDLFSLLKSSFRQNPDYLIVGEVRGKEAFVLFQGMASGHSSLSTMHADSVDTLIRRLQTPPINLSPTLVNSLDCVAIATHAIAQKHETRRLREIVEIVNVNKDGTALINTPFIWDPVKDVFYFRKQSKVFEKIAARRGLSIEWLEKELMTRAKLLYELYMKKIYGFDEIQSIINSYYKNPAEVLNKYNIKE